jgi:hypothetical protein
MPNLQLNHAGIGIGTHNISKIAIVYGMLNIGYVYTQLRSLDSAAICVRLGFQSIIHKSPLYINF